MDRSSSPPVWYWGNRHRFRALASTSISIFTEGHLGVVGQSHTNMRSSRDVGKDAADSSAEDFNLSLATRGSWFSTSEWHRPSVTDQGHPTTAKPHQNPSRFGSHLGEAHCRRPTFQRKSSDAHGDPLVELDAVGPWRLSSGWVGGWVGGVGANDPCVSLLVITI